MFYNSHLISILPMPSYLAAGRCKPFLLVIKVKVHSSQFNDVMYVVMSSQSLRNKNVMLVIFDISETV